MVRLVTMILLSLSTITIVAQESIENTIYLQGTLGTGVPLSNSENQIFNSNLEFQSLEIMKVSAFIMLKNNLGLHLNLSTSGIWYDIPKLSLEVNNPDIYLLNNNRWYGTVKSSLLSGIAYKFQFRRLVIIPFFDAGIVLLARPDIEPFYLKVKNSNNIMVVSNNAQLKYSRIDYAFGADFYFPLKKNWGFAASIQYDRFASTARINSVVQDYYNHNSMVTDNIGFDHRNIMISFGVFVSFLESR